MSDEENKTRATTGVKFSAFKQVGPMEGNPVEVVGLRDGENVRANLTTDLVETNPEITFRNSKGQFAAVDPGVLALTNQLKVNRYFYERLAEMGVPIGEDPPSETPKDGAFWFDNSEDVMQLFMWHAESDAWLPIAPPTTLEGRVATGEATQQAIIDQIQESLVEQRELKDKVNALEGAVGEHSLVFTMDNSNPREGEFNLKDGAMQITNTLASADYITLSDTDRNGNPIDLDRVTEGDVLRFSSIDGQVAELKITDGTLGVFAFTKVSGELDRLSEYPYDFVLLSSFDPAGLATKDYVDARDKTKIGRRAIWTLENDTPWILRQDKLDGEKKEFIKIHDGKMNLTNVASPGSSSEAANKSYVDQAIAAAIANIANQQSTPKPAQFSWKYGGSGTIAPPAGYFYKNGNNYYLSLKSNNGLEVKSGPEKSWGPANASAFEMTVWRKDGDVWTFYKHVEHDKAYFFYEDTSSSKNMCIRFHQKWESNTNTYASQTEYFITVGGFF